MRLYILYIVLALANVSICSAAPSKTVAVAFIKEMEAAVKKNEPIIKSGSIDAIRDHSLRLKKIKEKADGIFTPAAPPTGSCAYAASSAVALWDSMLQFMTDYKSTSAEFVSRRQEDYSDNLKLCKESVRSFK